MPWRAIIRRWWWCCDVAAVVMKPSFVRRRKRHTGILACLVFLLLLFILHRSLPDLELENLSSVVEDGASTAADKNAGIKSTIQNVETYQKHKSSCLPSFPLSLESFWTRTENSWTFSNEKLRSPLVIKEKQQRSFSSNHSLVFYGSSHLREVYFALIRLHRGISYNAILEDTVKLVGSGSPESPTYNATICDPGHTGWVQGKYGVDLLHCGPPGKRLVTELSPRVAIGFKTFLHTPQADEEFVDFLQECNLSSPSIVVVDVGIWGPRGTRISSALMTTMSPLEELNYYLDWIQRTFSTSTIVFIYDNLYKEMEQYGYTSSLVLERIQDAVSSNKNRAVLLRKDWIVRDIPRDMPCGHGCAGPAVQVLAHLLLDWLEQTASDCLESL